MNSQPASPNGANSCDTDAVQDTRIDRWAPLKSTKVVIPIVGFILVAFIAAAAYSAWSGVSPAGEQVATEQQSSQADAGLTAEDQALSRVATGRTSGAIAGFSLIGGWMLLGVVMATRAHRRKQRLVPTA